MQRIPPRTVMYTRDVINITGKSHQSALRLMYKVRKAKNKSPKDMVTIDDFCEYTKITEEVVRGYVT